MVFDTVLASELVKMKSDIASLYKDSILLDLIFLEDSTLLIMSDTAVQSSNLKGIAFLATMVVHYSK